MKTFSSFRAPTECLVHLSRRILVNGVTLMYNVIYLSTCEKSCMCRLGLGATNLRICICVYMSVCLSVCVFVCLSAEFNKNNNDNDSNIE